MKKTVLGFMVAILVGAGVLGFATTEVRAAQEQHTVLVRAQHVLQGQWWDNIEGIHFGLRYNGVMVDNGITNDSGWTLLHWSGSVDGAYIYVISSPFVSAETVDSVRASTSHYNHLLNQFSKRWEFTRDPYQSTPPPVVTPPTPVGNVITVVTGSNPRIELNGIHVPGAELEIRGEGHTMVPLRMLSELIGAEVGFDDVGRRALVNFPNGQSFVLPIDSMATECGLPLAYASFIGPDGRTRVPLAFFRAVDGVTVNSRPGI